MCIQDIPSIIHFKNPCDPHLPMLRSRNYNMGPPLINSHIKYNVCAFKQKVVFLNMRKILIIK